MKTQPSGMLYICIQRAENLLVSAEAALPLQCFLDHPSRKESINRLQSTRRISVPELLHVYPSCWDMTLSLMVATRVRSAPVLAEASAEKVRCNTYLTRFFAGLEVEDSGAAMLVGNHRNS